jgi:hypothetical protein
LRDDRIARCEGRHGQAFVAFIDLPCRSCSIAGHARRYATPDFGADLTNAIFGGRDVPVSRTGLLRRLSCHACGQRLEGSGARVVRVEGAIRLADLPAFRVELSAPGARCAACSAEQVLSSRSVAFDMSEAVARAFGSIPLKP